MVAEPFGGLMDLREKVLRPLSERCWAPVGLISPVRLSSCARVPFITKNNSHY